MMCWEIVDMPEILNKPSLLAWIIFSLFVCGWFVVNLVDYISQEIMAGRIKI